MKALSLSVSRPRRANGRHCAVEGTGQIRAILYAWGAALGAVRPMTADTAEQTRSPVILVPRPIFAFQDKLQLRRKLEAGDLSTVGPAPIAPRPVAANLHGQRPPRAESRSVALHRSNIRQRELAVL